MTVSVQMGQTKSVGQSPSVVEAFSHLVCNPASIRPVLLSTSESVVGGGEPVPVTIGFSNSSAISPNKTALLI